jgi:hypothetical protein
MLDESAKGMFRDGKDKTPLEEVKDTHQQQIKSISDATPKHTFPGLQTPVWNIAKPPPVNYEASAMKGVAFTATGEALATPAPAELTPLFVNSPRVGLNFTKICDWEGEEGSDRAEDESDAEGPPPSPSIRDRAKSELKSTQQRDSSNGVHDTRGFVTFTAAAADPVCIC